MFFRNKRRPNDVEGYDRISRNIDERADGGEDDDLFEEDTVLLTRDGAGSPPAGRGRESFALVDDSVEESVTVVRAPERPAAREAQPTVTPATVSPPAVAPAPPVPAPAAPAGMTAQGFESPRMSLPDTSFGGGQAGAVSLVAKEATWEGKLVTSGNVRIEGALVGEVETAATLFVAAEARVDGTVRARNVTLAGEIKGDLQCQEKLEILPGGAARGEVNTGTLVVHEGAFIDSRFQMRSAAAG